MPRQLRRYRAIVRGAVEREFGTPLSCDMSVHLSFVGGGAASVILGDPTRFFFVTTTRCRSVHHAAKHTNLLRKAARRSATYTVTRYVQKQQLQVLSCNVTTLKVPHTRCS
jgi:hypothetical protein